jgi:large subunit ribosomal protein L29
MKKADLTQLSASDLSDTLKEEIASLEKMQYTHTISPVESPARITHARKNVARLKTEARKRELAATKK